MYCAPGAVLQENIGGNPSEIEAPKAPSGESQRCKNLGAKSAEWGTYGMGRGHPSPIRLGGLGSVVSSPSGAGETHFGVF